MKFYNKTLLALSLAICLFSTSGVFAKEPLSPAMDILKNSLEIKKCTSSTSTLNFSVQELERSMGAPLSDFITINSLPDSSIGTLTISGVKVQQNQTVSKSSIEHLSFEPAKGAQGQTDFTFTDGMENSAFDVKCTLNVLSSLNLTPSAYNSSIKTAKNISIYDTLKANDPEDDTLVFEIVKYPKKGSVKILNEETGSFVYTPVSNKKGKDSFTFKVCDKYGNTSDIATVDAFIENKTYSSELSDMDNHWAKLSALKMCDMGLMTTSDVDGKTIFNPEGTVSRGDFLAMAMIVTGNEKNVNLCYTTTFADDSLIPHNIKSYAESALAMGVISGYSGEDNESICFASQNPITVAEASVILQKLSKAPKPIINPDINDINLVPVWAQDSIYSLMANGIINGDENGFVNSDAHLTRDRAAQMLCNTMDYIKETEQKPKKTIFNLFGLLK